MCEASPGVATICCDLFEGAGVPNKVFDLKPELDTQTLA